MTFNIWDLIIPTTPGHLLIEGLIIGIVILIIRKIKEKRKLKHSHNTPKMNNPIKKPNKKTTNEK